MSVSTNPTESKGTILVVDDTPANLDALTQMLSVAGYTVRVALSGKLALKSIQLNSPDLILLNIMMPKMDGYQVCQLLKNNTQTKDIPVIFISVADEVLNKVKAFQVGGVDYMTQPFSVEEALTRIENQFKISRLSKLLTEQNERLQQEILLRQQAEQALRESEERWQLALKGINGSIWDRNLKTGEIFHSTRWSQMLGYEDNEIENNPDEWNRRLHPDDFERVMATRQAYLDQKIPNYIVEYRIRAKDGSYKWMLSRGQALWDELGNPIRIVGSHEDINDRKSAELEISRAKAALEQQLQRILLQERITQEIHSSLKPEQFFQTAAIQIGQVFNVDRCLVHLYIEFPTPRIPIVAEYRRLGIQPTWSLEIPVIGNSHIQQLLSQDSAIASANIEQEPLLEAALPLCRQVGLKSMLAVRTSYQGKANGLMCVHEYGEQRNWTDWEIELLEAVAVQLGIAIAQANLLTQERQRRIELDQQNQQLQKEIRVRRQAQEKLRLSQKRYRQLFEGSVDGIAIANLEGRFIDCNASYQKMLGYSLTELQQKKYREVTPSKWHEIEEKICKNQVMIRGYSDTYEKEYIRKDGTVFPVEFTVYCLKNDEGQPEILWAITRDISDRKQAQERLRLQAEREQLMGAITQRIRQSLNLDEILKTTVEEVRQLLQNDRVVLFKLCDDGVGRVVVESVAPGLPITVGEEFPDEVFPEEIYQYYCHGKPRVVTDIIHDQFAPCITEYLEKLGVKSKLVIPILCSNQLGEKGNGCKLNPPTSLWGVMTAHDCSGQRQWLEWEIELLSSLATQIGLAIQQSELYLKLEAELTERRRAEAALQQAKEAAEIANRAKSEFLAKMSHELRTPLNAILGFSQLINRHASLGSEHQEHLAIIIRSGEHLLELINDILEMSKIEAGRITLNETSFDLYRLLDNLQEMLHFKAQSKGLKLIFERTNEVPQYVIADEGKLRQVLINLLGNAIKFTQSGQVTLRLSRVHGKKQQKKDDAQQIIHFEVEDTGPGIAPEEIGSLFEAFTQTTTGRKFEQGSGLGLSISHSFVRLMGGDIAVSSTLGRGSTFKFDSPVKVAIATDILPLGSHKRVIGLAPNQRDYRLLVVEDNWANRLLLVKLLKLVGFQVREAANGEEAVALWSSWEPQLIFMDMRMPVMDGYEATKQIKSHLKGQATVIIALTASAFEENRTAILSVGCDDFVRKPFQEEELFSKIAVHLGVRYLYQELVQPTLTQSDATVEMPQNEFLHQVLLQMPIEWVSQLHQAASECSYELTLELIDQIPLDYTLLATTLKSLADNFLFEQLIELTEFVNR